jgi:nucleoside-diphosphate-sugar epimerase
VDDGRKEAVMKVLVTGATGAIGRPLVRLLAGRGHRVVGTTRSSEKAARLRADGAEPAVLDVLDRQAVVDAVVRAAPDAVVHQATALSGRFDMRRFGRFFEATNRLRTVGTDVLLEAARAAGAGRFVVQSYAGWPFGSDRPGLLSEDDPIDRSLPREMRSTADAIAHLEATTLGVEDLEGIVLRYGSFYGPGTSLWPGGEVVEALRKRQLPLVGDGAGVWSLIHVEDAAAATVTVLERGAPGVYHVVDDDPTRVAELLPELARIVGTRPPLRVPAWLARPLIGEAGVWVMTRVRGVSNARAKRELGWMPRYPSWRDGFAAGVSMDAAVGA